MHGCHSCTSTSGCKSLCMVVIAVHLPCAMLGKHVCLSAKWQPGRWSAHHTSQCHSTCTQQVQLLCSNSNDCVQCKGKTGVHLRQFKLRQFNPTCALLRSSCMVSKAWLTVKRSSSDLISSSYTQTMTFSKIDSHHKPGAFGKSAFSVLTVTSHCSITATRATQAGTFCRKDQKQCNALRMGSIAGKSKAPLACSLPFSASWAVDLSLAACRRACSAALSAACSFCSCLASAS